MKDCLLCNSRAVEDMIDFGHHVVCNRFSEAPHGHDATVPLALGVCHACGVVQLLSPPAVEDIRPGFDWLTCNEPEGHLDELAADIAGLQDVTPATASVCGVSFKDDSLLQRLRGHGFSNVKRLDPATDLDIHDRCAGIETVTAHLTPERARTWVARHGAATVVIARHIFEHASDPRRFAEALTELMAPAGILIIEIPDCEKALTVRDYTTVWEEHSLYFTPVTFRGGMESLGFMIRKISCIPYVLENSLIAIMRRADHGARKQMASDDAAREMDRARAFAGGFADRRHEIVGRLESFRRQHGRIAIFGAGHLACTYVNFFGLGGLIDCVVDDNPRKVGLFMPGSGIPIRSSRALADRDIKLCLLSVGAGGERTIIDKHGAFVARGGVFRSIFPASTIAFVN